MAKNQDCTTNGDGPDPYSFCKFPFKDSSSDLLINDCIAMRSPSGKNMACERLSNQFIKMKEKFPPDGYSGVHTYFLV